MKLLAPCTSHDPRVALTGLTRAQGKKIFFSGAHTSEAQVQRIGELCCCGCYLLVVIAHSLGPTPDSVVLRLSYNGKIFTITKNQQAQS
jgi:hypothetical protein